MAGAHCCGHARDNQGAFVKLIADAKLLKSTINFAFEKHVPEGLMFLQGNDLLNYGCVYPMVTLCAIKNWHG